jgi:hypothetical protein
MELDKSALGPARTPVATYERKALLRRGALAAGALAAGGAVTAGLPRLAASQPSSALDVRILNFALVLEEVQAAFYRVALAAGNLTGEVERFARTAGGNEREHVALLRRLLGARARPAPTTDFGDATANARVFLRTAITLEELGLAAYNGQVANLRRESMMHAFEIVSVEGRHAAWARDLAGELPAPVAADRAITASEAAAELRRTGFVRS